MAHPEANNPDEIALSFESNLNAFARMAHQETNNPDEIALPFESDLHDHPLTYTFSKLRLRKVCPKGPEILDSDWGRGIRLSGLNPYGHDEQLAFYLIRNMLNGEDDVFGPAEGDISPRVLLYMTELYIWLSNPTTTFVKGASV